jgi:peptidoglycan hydrolase-like protein with peptidoglycan-binding domain
MCMRKNRVIISGMVFSALTLSPLVGWSQSSPGTSGPSSSGMEQDRQRPGASDSSSGTSTGSMGRSAMNGQWSQDDVRSVQEALKGKGHNPGPIDGVIGPRTQQALRAFQRAQNIQTSGQLDSSTASALGVALSSGSSSTPGSSTPSSSSRGSSGATPSGSGTLSDPSSREGAGTGSSSNSNKSSSTTDDPSKSNSTKSGSSKSESGSSESGESKGGSTKSGSSKSGSSAD